MPGFFSPDGSNVSATRPLAKEAPYSEGWFQDVTAPGAGNGTTITQTLLNQIIANLRQIVSQLGGNADGSDTMLLLALQAGLCAKATYDPNNVNGDAFDMDAMVDGTDAVVMTPSERAKLAYITLTQALNLNAVAAEISRLESAYVLKGEWDASVGTFPGGGNASTGDVYVASAAGTVDSVPFSIGDRLQAIVDAASVNTYANNWAKLTSTGMGSLVEDTSPQLGGDLDMNGHALTNGLLGANLDAGGYNIWFDDYTGMRDDAGNEVLTVQKVASAVNYILCRNAAAGGAAAFLAAGSDANVDIDLIPKGTGRVYVGPTPLQTDGSYPPVITNGPVNLELQASAGSGALTISVRGRDYNNPSADNPVWVPMPDGGGYRKFTSAKSIVIPSGATLGVQSNTACRIWVVMFQDGDLGVIRCTDALTTLGEITYQFTALGGQYTNATAIGTGADSPNTFYAEGAQTSQPFIVLGYLEWNTGGMTAGTWTTTNLIYTRVAGRTSLIMPGHTVQRKRIACEVLAVTSNTTYQVKWSSQFWLWHACNVVRLTAPPKAYCQGDTLVHWQWSRGTTDNANFINAVESAWHNTGSTIEHTFPPGYSVAWDFANDWSPWYALQGRKTNTTFSLDIQWVEFEEIMV